MCLEGERACPPEDCGGPWGYADYLAAIADPNHEQHVALLAWRGPFDPEAFDAKKATKEMRKACGRFRLPTLLKGKCSMATFITAAPDGTLWFTEPNGKVGRLTTDGYVREYVFSNPYSEHVGN